MADDAGGVQCRTAMEELGGAAITLLQRDAAERRALLSHRSFGVAGEQQQQQPAVIGVPSVASSAGAFGNRKHCHLVQNGDASEQMVQCYPDLMLVGESKCGSSSIAAYMVAHPQVVVQTWFQGADGWDVGDNPKQVDWELHVFDKHRTSIAEMDARQWATAPLIPAAEAGDFLQLHYRPNYLYYPDVPFHIAEAYPNARSIKYFAVLREPVARAVSSWKFHSSVMETRSFREAVDDGIAQRHALEACYAEELSKIAGPGLRARHPEELDVVGQRDVLDRCFWGRHDSHDTRSPPNSFGGLMLAHVDKGVYVDQVRRWFSVLGRENFFTFSLEEWSRDPAGMYTRLADFAGYEAIGAHGFHNASELDALLAREFNDGNGFFKSLGLPVSDPPEPAAELKQRLADFYEPYNEELFALLGRRLW